MVKSLVSKLSTASNLSLASTFSAVGSSIGGGLGGSGTQETNYAKHRNDPGRFFGDGVQFKAKLIGILEVGEARGDRMCQEALQDLKMAIRAAGEHKQRITIHVTIEGLRLRDEKTGDSLYHHPVHKISFIAQDMTDSRAFGYIFGSPDSGHRFFGIKTDKAASQVVLAMRDLFQVVFELKKKEIELARQQIQTKSLHDHQSQLASLASLKSAAGVTMGHNDLGGASVSGMGGTNTLTMLGSLGAHANASSGMSRLGVNMDAKGAAAKELSPESVADLVDLEQELSSLQRGITQMERITPNEPPVGQTSGSAITKTSSDDDPFGDSFTNFPTYNILPPPPETGRTRGKPLKSLENNISSGAVSALLSPATAAGGSPSTLQQHDEDRWLHEIDQQQHHDVFDTSKANTTLTAMGLTSIGNNSIPMAPLAHSESTSTPTQQLNENSVLANVEQQLTGVNTDQGISNDFGQTQTQKQAALAAEVLSDPVSTAASTGSGTGDDPVLLPRDTDPFSPTRKKSDPDPFQEGDLFSKIDSFEFEFGAKDERTTKGEADGETTTSSNAINTEQTSAGVFNGPLQVQLPPEGGISPLPNWKSDISRLERQTTHESGSTINSTVRSRPTPTAMQISLSAQPPASIFKQQTADVISSISNKKMPHLFGQARFSKRDTSNSSVNMRRLQESDSLSENEAAPEPPPRPDSTPYVEPPPLPPKKQFNDIVIRPRQTVTASGLALSMSTGSRYEHLNNATSNMRNTNIVGRSNGNIDLPPIPLPSRRVGRSDGYFPGPSRPRKPGHTEDDYVAPIEITVGSSSVNSHDLPPLLPPPAQSSSRIRAHQRQITQYKPQEIYENKAEIVRNSVESLTAAIVPDITLSQLLTLGIDELAIKLNVPISKLNTMTLVELTSYLSEYLSSEKTKPKSMTASSSIPRPRTASPVLYAAEESKSSANAAIFKVNFDQQTSFVAKFDDTFGEDIIATQETSTFVANFANFNEPPVQLSSTVVPKSTHSQSRTPAVPPADRYAVFREIIDQELQQQKQDSDLMGDLTPPPVMTKSTGSEQSDHADNDEFSVSPTTQRLQEQQQHTVPKIDTKITEVVAQAKDRYAALRDIILVENLFEKPQPPPSEGLGQKDLLQEFTAFGDEYNEDHDLQQILDDRASNTAADRRGLVDSRGLPAEPSSSALTVDDDEDEDAAAESSLDDSNEKDTGAQLLQDQYKKLSTSIQQLNAEKPTIYAANEPAGEPQIHSTTTSNKQDNKFLIVSTGSGALTGSRDDLEIDDLMQRAISNLSLDSRERISPATSTGAVGVIPQVANTTANSLGAQLQFNDVSTSPIPQQKSPMQQKKSPVSFKSPEASPIPTQLSAVSQLIDTATKQMTVRGVGENIEAPNTLMAKIKNSKESWATFESPKSLAYVNETVAVEKRNRQTTSDGKKTASSELKTTTTLNLPPPPPSNTSQHDTAESPCSSDPRDEGWIGNKSAGGSTGRRWPKKDRQQTSSSSRDLSPWDDDTPEYQKRRLPPGLAAQHAHADRHGYYMRHARRMNSCDEDYDYDDEFCNRRTDQRKFKQGLSRSRDNFELDSPSWYHHPTAHNTWSPQNIEQASRARSFERSAYERSSYGPPIYDKRGNPLPPLGSSYDRRMAYDKRGLGSSSAGKYYRDYVRPNYEFDDYGDSPTTITPTLSKHGRRVDYENVYDDGRSPLGYKSRTGGDYMYERERKSFDRESIDSFDSATRRRRSFGSGGDVYGSLESRDDYHRERYLGSGGGGGTDLKTRSLRKPTKFRATDDIDYEQDSENDFHAAQPPRSNTCVRPVDVRNMQRPSQLSEIVGGSAPLGPQSRLRKSSGSSPWDGEEPPLPGQKSWKRPSNLGDAERRLTESRRTATMVQTPSDGEKDRRFRKKTRARGGHRDLPTTTTVAASNATGGRYVGSGSIGGVARNNYDYIASQDDDIDDDYVDDEEYEEEPPTDEDKFERLNRRRHEMHQRMYESERRQDYGVAISKNQPPSLSTTRTISSGGGGSIAQQQKSYSSVMGGGGVGGDGDYGFDSFEQTPTPRSNASSSVAMMSATSDNGANTKFNFDDGFESDFNQNSPPPAPAAPASSCNITPAGCGNNNTGSSMKSIFRFSNDFTDREKAHSFHQQLQQHQHQPLSQLTQQQFELDEATTSTTPPTITQKLRFDDNVKVSQFDDAAFEDDFAKASFDFEKVEQNWQQLQDQRNNMPSNTISIGNTTNTNVAVLSLQPTTKKQNLRNSKFQQRQELIKKSESVNIFAKKVEDPFEDDEFFKSPIDLHVEEDNNEEKPSDVNSASSYKKTASSGSAANNFQWDDDSNFAKFDENM